MSDPSDDLRVCDGSHVIRFEPGATAAMSVEQLIEHPPEALGGLRVDSIDVDPDNAVVVDLAGGQVQLRVTRRADELEVAGKAPDPDARMVLGSTLRAAVDLLADPERAALRRRFEGLGDDSATHERAAALFGARAGAGAIEDRLRLVVSCIDLTTLAGDDTPGRVRALGALARRPDPADAAIGPVAAVCVYPALVPAAVAATGGSPVRVAAVAGAFPAALSSFPVRLADVRDAAEAGADEIDVVLDRCGFLVGDHERVLAELAEMRDAAGDATLKTIIEIDELPGLGAVRAATRLAIDAGSDFVKTSTGKVGGGATPAAVLAIAEEIRDHERAGGGAVGLKVSGGVRSADDALGYLAIVEDTLGPAWLHPDRFRIGASSLLGAVVDAIADLGRTLDL